MVLCILLIVSDSKYRLIFRLRSISVKDALLRFSRVYEIVDGKKTIISEIPASSAKLDEQLGTNIFPKKLRS